jgi:uncharacterized phage-associated protein
MSANSVADFFIRKGEIGGEAMTQLPLQKLLYLTQGWHLALVGEPLFDEEFHAWKNGPVVRGVRHRLRSYSSAPIPPNMARERPECIFQDPSLNLMERVYQTYRHYGTGDLVGLTHFPGGPWAHARNRARNGGSDVISKERIKAYFERQWQRALDNMVVIESPDCADEFDEARFGEGGEQTNLSGRVASR